MASPHAMAGQVLAVKPAQRSAEDVERLVAFMSKQPFFAGVSTTSLELLSTCLGIQHAAPGEVVLHAGELTDRMYLLLSGTCSVVRHSRKEGFQPQPPELLLPGQALCEASLVVSGRRSDVAVKVEAPAGAAAPAPAAPAAGRAAGTGVDGTSAAGSGDGSSSSSNGSSGASLVVLTRASWNNMCARAPLKPEFGEARMAMLCCCARALAASDPRVRTLEQAEDLAALLRLLPGLSHTSAPVLRAMSEAAFLRQLPAGTIMFEECTKADSEFVVLSGAVEAHSRPRRQGAANRAALRSALRSAVAAARGKSAKGGPKGAGEAPAKTIRQKIEEERRAREQIKQSLVLQREGLRTPKANSNRPTGAKAVEEEFKKWMLEFLSRKRSGPDNPAAGAGGGGGPPGVAGGGVSKAKAAVRAVSAKAANAWRRAAAKALHSTGDGDGGAGGGEGAVRAALERSDTTLMEYERRKLEEAGGVKDVGNLLGGAAAHKAYRRGLEAKDGGMYAEDDDVDAPEDKHGAEAGKGGGKPGGIRWGPNEESTAAPKDGEGLELDVEDVDEEDADPWVMLTFLDRRYQVVRKPIRYIDAVEKVMGIAKQESADADKSSSLSGAAGNRSGADADADGDGDGAAAADDIHLLLLNGADDGAGAGAGGSAGPTADGGLVAGGGAGAAAAAAAPASGPGPDDVVDDACDEHLEQLYGPRGVTVDAGQVAGELPAAVLDRSKRGPQRTRRAHSAIAGPSGADVLVVALEALRRGHEAARDDLVSERLAVLTALEPLRGLSDEHQAQLALACTVLSVDTNHVIVRQGQPVEALHVVLEGEVRLLDDPDTTPSVAPPPQQQPVPPVGGAGGAGAAPGGGPGGAGAAAGSGAGGAGGGVPDPPNMRSMAAAAGGKMLSLKIRRAAASLPALSLLGPGGSFGESVLGYPEDPVVGAGRASFEGDGAEAAVPSSQYLATAMASRPTKLLVLPRSLLVKYGYLRTSLPPFASLRREALSGRRQQLKVSVQNRQAAAAATATVTTGNGGGGAAAAAGGGKGSGGGGGGPPGPLGPMTGGLGMNGASGALQLPSLPSPTAPLPMVHTGAYQIPRPPPVRPSEVLEQLGFKPVMRRMYNAGGKPSGGGGGAGSHPTPNGTTNGATPAASSGGGGGNGSNGGGGPGPLPHPIVSVNNIATAAGGGGGGHDRQHRRDLLAASALATNAPHSLSNAITRARGEDHSAPSAVAPSATSATSSALLPFVVHGIGASPSQPPPPPYRGSTDGSMASAAPSYSSGTGGPAGALVLPTPFSVSAAARLQRPLRLSVSGLGNFTTDSNSPSPVRRSSLSGLVVTNGLVGGAGGGGAGASSSMPALASPPLRVGSKPHTGPASAPTAHLASVQLPRLSMPGNSSSGSATPTGGGGGGGARPAGRQTGSGDPYLVRLEATESSPRSCSPQHSAAHQRGQCNAAFQGGRSLSTGSAADGGGGGSGGGGARVSPPPLAMTLLGQRSGGHQPVARA